MFFNIPLLFALCFAVTLAEIEHRCSDTKRLEIEQHLATKTPYRVVANLDDRVVEYPECKAVRMWSVIRHGARNPSKKEIQRTKEKLTKIRDKIVDNHRARLCPQEVAMLKFWYFDLHGKEEKFLVPEGEDELIELAERMQKRFPQLLKSSYDPESYHFKYTATQRTLKSAESFATGLFGRDKIKQIVYPEALHKDPILRFYKLCNRWKEEVDENPDALEEAKLFAEGIDYSNAVKHIEQRAHLKSVSAKDAHLMYKICAFETAWNKNGHVSPWCALFNRETIRVMEFFEDLEYYWIDGYGFELTHKQACPAIKDMFEHIDLQSNHPNATFYFTHSGTMLKLLAHLGLYKDDFVLTHADFNRTRRWRTSAIDAFASNLVFTLFECADEPKVLVQHQERVVRIPGCPGDTDLCPLKTLKQLFRSSIERCNFDEICDLSDE